MKYLAAKCLLSKRVLNSLIVIATVIFSGSDSQDVLAQITPDESLGTESSVVTPDVEVKGETADRIDGGAIRERNLFHSFQEFNVREGQSVYFASPERIENIFTRVTGNNPSNILGTLGVDGAANLLLLNPNGILFGENSSLDVEGSFLGTTAESLIFRDGTEFSAVEPSTPLLTISVPLGLQFGSNPGNIMVQSPLEVPNGQNFSFVGGNIDLKGSNIDTSEDGMNSAADGITAPGGRIELGGLSATGIVNFEDSSNLIFPDGIPRGNITIDNFFIDASGGGGGSIAVYSKNLRLTNSIIATGIDFSVESTEERAGDITIDTAEEISLEASNESVSGIFSATGDLSEFLVSTEDVEVVNKTGNAGNIIINTGSLSATGAFVIGSLTNGEGNAGSVNINANKSIVLENSTDSDANSRITSSVLSQGTGKGADIKINTPSLSLNNATISTTTFGAGNAGNLDLNISDSITVSNDSLLETTSVGQGNAGNLTINTDKLTVENSAISTATAGLGQAGNLDITATDFLSLRGAFIFPDGSQFFSIFTLTSGDGDAGDIAIKTRNLIATEGGQISAGTFGAGNGGNINIEAESIEITGKSADETFLSGIAASSFSSGTGGKIRIITDSLVIRDGGLIVAEARDAGDAGSIDLDTEQLIVEHSGISTSNNNTGKAGNLDITASEFILLRGTFTDVNGDVIPAGLFSSTFDGDATAGDLNVNAGKLTLSDGAQIQSATASSGDGGNIAIKADRIELTGNSGKNFPSVITALTNGSGDGGKVNITTDNLVISDGAGISVRSIEDGNAGIISVIVRDSFLADNGRISSFSTRSFGGDIDITAGNISLKGDSDIFTNVEEGAGGGGNITLTANSIIASDDSDIFAFSRDGVGGNITINSSVFLAENFTLNSLTSNPNNLRDNARVDLNATGVLSGLVDIPNVNVLSDSLVELSENAIDTEELVANSCVVRDRPSSGTFIITGKGGLPARPGNWTVSSYSTGDVRAIPNETNTTSTNNNWRSGDPIVEPQGIYRLSNGKLVLSRECS